jgi:hypothetical protein
METCGTMGHKTDQKSATRSTVLQEVAATVKALLR